MECWIGVVTDGDRRVVRVAGRLERRARLRIAERLRRGAALEIDLTDLASADNAGIEALQRARTKGATLVGTPGYIQLKLDLLSARQH